MLVPRRVGKLVSDLSIMVHENDGIFAGIASFVFGD